MMSSLVLLSCVAQCLAQPGGESQGWLNLSHPQKEPSSFIPTPETARLVFYTDEWLVWATRRMVAGTERWRAQMYAVRFFMNRNPGERAHFVYETHSPRGYPMEGVLKDGTFVVERFAYTGELLLVKPDGTEVELAGAEQSPQFGKHSVLVNEVSDDGVLIQLYKLDPQGVGPVYFVPWSTHGLDFGKMILVTDQKGALAGWVVREKEKVVTIGRTKIQVFNLTTRKRVDYPAKPLVDGAGWELPDLQASDGETMIFGTIGVKDGVKEVTVTPVFDLRAGKFDYTRYIPERVIAVKDRIIYAVTEGEEDEKEGMRPNLLVAADLDSPNGKRQILMDLGNVAELVYIIRPDALSIWTNKEWRRIPWLSKKRVRRYSPQREDCTAFRQWE